MITFKLIKSEGIITINDIVINDTRAETILKELKTPSVYKGDNVKFKLFDITKSKGF